MVRTCLNQTMNFLNILSIFVTIFFVSISAQAKIYLPHFRKAVELSIEFFPNPIEGKRIGELLRSLEIMDRQTLKEINAHFVLVIAFAPEDDFNELSETLLDEALSRLLIALHERVTLLKPEHSQIISLARALKSVIEICPDSDLVHLQQALLDSPTNLSRIVEINGHLLSIAESVKRNPHFLHWTNFAEKAQGLLDQLKKLYDYLTDLQQQVMSLHQPGQEDPITTLPTFLRREKDFAELLAEGRALYVDATLFIALGMPAGMPRPNAARAWAAEAAAAAAAVDTAPIVTTPSASSRPPPIPFIRLATPIRARRNSFTGAADPFFF